MAAAAMGRSAGVPAENTAPDRLIDRDHLIRQCLGDPGLEIEILRTFDAMIGTYGQRLRATSRREDMMVLLHTIRGAAAGIGANPLAVLAREAEQEYSETGRLSVECLDDVVMAIEELRVHIARLLPDEDDQPQHLTSGL